MTSIVDRKLARYGMEWQTSPYQIINKYGVVVQKQHFALRDEVLTAQQDVQLEANKFKKVSEYQSE